MERRLAAILAADVVGYSRMMEQDEAGTMAALKARRKDVLEPLVAQHRGRIFKVTGDGVLVEFASAVNAVQCAVDLQHDMAAANVDQTDDRHIVLRIGLNLGDVMVESSDLYGDGVNVAARLEALAEPGGILISGTAYDYVRNKVKVGFDDLGPQTLKNIAEPVRAFRAADMPAVTITLPKATTDKPSIAVLPFTNMSGDPEQEYFSDGITEDIITELSRFRSLRVIARNSSFQYRDKATDVRRIARELGVGLLVEGSVRKAGNNVRITAQLIDALTGQHVWADRYDRELADIFSVQDEVVEAIASRVVRRIEEVEISKARRKPPGNLAAYDYFLRGVGHLHRVATSDFSEAQRFLEMAIERDPEYAQAYAVLAYILLLQSFEASNADESRTFLVRAKECANRGLELDDSEIHCHAVIGQVYAFERRFDEATYHMERAVALNPNDPFAMTRMAGLLTYLGRHDEAMAWLSKVQRIDPSPPNYFWEICGIAHYMAKRYESATASFRRMTALQPSTYGYMAACLAQMGSHDEAQEAMTEFLRWLPNWTVSSWATVEAFKHDADLQHLLEGLRKAGLPE